MTAREIHLPVAAQPTVDSLVEYARTAEDAGYDCVWLPETWGRDAVTVLTSIAEHTDSIDLGSSIVNTYSRSPALLGQTAATLQEVSGGRFRLGIGPSGPIVIENWHGLEYGNPLRRTRETVEIVQQVLSGEPVEYDGHDFSLSGFRLRCTPPDPQPPVEVTGMGPKAVELAGRFADGWHGIMLTPDGTRDRLEDVERGADLGDRDPEDVAVSVGVTCCVLDDPARARDLARQHVGFYVGGMGTFYRDSLERQGYDEAAEIHDAWQADERDRALELIDDDMLDQLCAAGDLETARESLERFEAVDGLDAVMVSFPRGADESEVSETMAALAPTGD
ncbi:TIGR04024 family LLM class F420-dependent oxidoreductase [Natrarchaeobaculum sulfurireducens]|uniref:Coenzyme F420-dependent N5,N10-methylene tetrahydromethanopterin reductase or related flavin-dependent oxidoreductase n=1 Tax=Natrarchaeobaculum sulfurireducens TaxID=2044521 RepID=A0A346PBI0_9EURY|nr:TIGR04024 family LLM class F420-dependent oxidoreductase [Natrarchaeobaculum sulfurireducens]AXR76875.1 Coenzyme F420-dependent N5,N10-methylene tetrahydromethanopterin reductase or related flavin-dependent oxidoreductase [Natrarchaeobaculum sulfurireducens]